jgi:phosphotransferase system HPr (HPr) family protein
MLAQIVKPFNAQISINYNNEKADARDVLHILSLAVFPGEVQFEAEGPDAGKALDAIEKFIADLNKNPMW